jgi:hypothetical protein
MTMTEQLQTRATELGDERMEQAQRDWAALIARDRRAAARRDRPRRPAGAGAGR